MTLAPELSSREVVGVLPFGEVAAVDQFAALVGGIVRTNAAGDYRIEERKRAVVVLPAYGLDGVEVGAVWRGQGVKVGDSIVARVDPDELEAMSAANLKLGKRRMSRVEVELVAVTGSTNSLPWQDAFEPEATGFGGYTLTNRSGVPTFSGRAGINADFRRQDIGSVGKTLWSQSGVLLSGSAVRLESGEVQSRDLQTRDSSATSTTQTFTTQVERRTIGTVLEVSGDFDGEAWWLGVQLEARSVARGAENLVKVDAKPVLKSGDWFALAELTKNQSELILRALPGRWWKSKRLLGSDQRYVLRLRVVSL